MNLYFLLKKCLIVINKIIENSTDLIDNSEIMKDRQEKKY